MKSLKILASLTLFISLISCGEKTKKDYHAEHDNFNKEIKELKIKLDATEAQLLNVQTELAALAGKDSTIKQAIKAE